MEHLRTAKSLPIVILLDLVMPNMDGWQFLAVRRKDACVAEIPIVLISGHLSAAETARKHGLAGCVEKPIVQRPSLECSRAWPL